jgi:16S rRNA (guanine527-N7)-methyltransferase
MTAARIAELLGSYLNACHSSPGCEPGEEPALLSPAQLHHISTYIDLLRRWNSRVNLTAIRNEEEIVTRHFGESLFAARHLFPTTAYVAADASVRPPDQVSAPRVADLGSGAGFPGIPIKLWAPHIALTLIESNQKKVAFLREVVRALTLTDVNIQNVRAETITQTFDVVTLRAVERFKTILPVAAGLFAPSARLALLISTSQVEHLIAVLPHLIWQPALPIPNTESRLLLIGNRNQSSKQVGAHQL